jgi:DMSO reductase anchor subunit
MHPAPSVILFSVLSGLGFGLLAFLGFDAPSVRGGTAFGYYFVGYGLAVGGLIMASLHLANPKNAIKSFRQWRSSWLAREGIIAITALLITAVPAISSIFAGTYNGLFGALSSILCLATVFCTAMIYAQLRSIPRWNQPLTPAVFMMSTIAGGALLAGQSTLAMVLLILLIIVHFLYWSVGDKRFGAEGSTIETATGLGRIGKTRLLESPHTGKNYLLSEMVYVIGRKHSQKLRIIAVIFLGVIPVLLLSLVQVSMVVSIIAAIIHLIGMLTARWLFFAEAEHVVGLYYDKR